MAALAATMEQHLIQSATPEVRAARARFEDAIETMARQPETEPEFETEDVMAMPIPGLKVPPAGIVGQGRAT